MARFKKMVSMERTDEEKHDARREMFSSPIDDMPDVPPGLCICLTESELSKLDLDDDVEVGDMLHMFAMAKVTSVSKHDTGSGPKCRVELSITDMEIEDEDDEDGEDD
jgi:hypothetical protein